MRFSYYLCIVFKLERAHKDTKKARDKRILRLKENERRNKRMADAKRKA